MSDILKAADDIRKLARLLDSMNTVAGVLDRVGSVEQAEVEAKARIDALLAQEAPLKSVAEQVKAEAEAEAQRILDTARAQAEQISRDASSVAQATRDEAGRIYTSAVQSAATERDALTAQAAELTGHCAELSAARDAAAQELADITAKIERAKAKMAELLRA